MMKLLKFKILFLGLVKKLAEESLNEDSEKITKMFKQLCV